MMATAAKEVNSRGFFCFVKFFVLFVCLFVSQTIAIFQAYWN